MLLLRKYDEPEQFADGADAAGATDRQERQLLVGNGISFRGEILGCHHLVVAGRVEAKLGSCRALQVLEGGSFKGSASLAEARIVGSYEGALTVRNMLFVGACAQVRGTVQCGHLEIEDGGRIEGALTMSNPTPGSAKELADAAPGAPASKEGAVENDEEPEAIFASATAVGDCAALAETEAMLRSALDANPLDRAALSGLGHLERQRGNPAAALECFAALIAADPEDPSPRCVAANLLRRLSRLDEAKAMYKSVLAIEPRSAEALIGLGHIAQDRGDQARAQACFDAARAVALEAARMRRAVAGTPADCAWIEKAEAMFKSVLERAPKNIEALAGLGQLARRRGDREAVRHWYSVALAIAPLDLALRIEAAQALREAGEGDEACRILETMPNEA